MGCNEARAIVQSGLDRRKADRQQQELENRLEQYERDMITTINDRHSSRVEVVSKDKPCAVKLAELQEKERRREARREARAREEYRAQKAANAVKVYAAVCLTLLLLSAWTPFPWWAVLTFTLFGMSLPLAFAFRLYNSPQ